MALVDVERDSIATDYELSTGPRRALLAAMGHEDDLALYERALDDRALAARGTTARAAVLATLEGFDAETYLRSAGLTADDLTLVRSRLLDQRDNDGHARPPTPQSKRPKLARNAATALRECAHA